MKRLLPLLLILFCFSARATDVLISLQDSRILAAPYTNRTIYIDPYSTPTVNSPSVVMGNRIIAVTDTNGNFLVQSNFPGLYQVTVTAPPMLERFKYLVTSSQLGQINAADNLVADAGATFPGGSVAWAAAVSDGRYSRGTNAGVSFMQVTNALGYTPAPSGSYQPAATGLTNWNNVATNLVAYLTQLGTAAFSNTAAFYLNNNPSNYVTATVTNGLQSASVIGTAAYSNATSFYLNTNPSNYVTATVTNGLQSASVIGTAAFSNATAFTLQNSVTGIISGQFVGGSGNVVTNGPGITVQPSTNGVSFVNNLANISSGGLWGGQGANFVGTVFGGLFFGPVAGTLTNNTTGNSTLSTNSLNVATAVTNQWRTDATNTVNSLTNDPSIIRASVIGTAAYSNATAFYLNNNPSNYVTASVTNGLVTYNSYVTNANGVNVTNLNASNLTAGTVPLAQLSGITSNQLAVSTIGTNQLAVSAITWITNLVGTGGGTATNAIANNNGNGTNTTLYSMSLGDSKIIGLNRSFIDINGNGGDLPPTSGASEAFFLGCGNSTMSLATPVQSGIIAGSADYLGSVQLSTLIGGQRSTNTGNFSTIIGGYATATNNGVFMFGDSQTGSRLWSPADNSFSVRANGGAYFITAGKGLFVDGSPVGTVANNVSTNYANFLYFTNNANIYAGTLTGYVVGTISGTLTNNTTGNAAGATNVYGTVNGTQIVGGTITNAINSPSVASANFSGTASALTVTNLTAAGTVTLTNPSNIINGLLSGNAAGITNEPATGINFTTNGTLAISNTVYSSTTDTNNVLALTSATGLTSFSAGSLSLQTLPSTNIVTTTNAIFIGLAGSPSFSNVVFYLVTNTGGVSYTVNGLAASTRVTNILGNHWEMRQASSIRYSNANNSINSTWFIGTGGGLSPAPPVTYLSTTNVLSIGGTVTANAYRGYGSYLDMGPLWLQNYPTYGNTHHSVAYVNANPVFAMTNAGVVRNIWFTSYTSQLLDSSWYNRTNLEFRIYTDFGNLYDPAGSTNPSPQYLNFTAPVGVLLGNKYRPTNYSYSAVLDTRYLRVIDDFTGDSNGVNPFPYYSFGLNMAMPFTNSVWVCIYDRANGSNITKGFGETIWNSVSDTTLPYMNWRLRSYATNGIFGDGVGGDAGPAPFLNQTNGPGMWCGLLASMRRQPGPAPNTQNFEGSLTINFNNGENWSWHGAEDFFGFAWEMQAGGFYGFTNMIANRGSPVMTNSLGNTAQALYRSTGNNFGLTYYEGSGANAAVETYRYFGQDAVCWTNGAIGNWTQDPGTGTAITNVPIELISIFYAP